MTQIVCPPYFIAVFTPTGGNSPKQVKEQYDYSIVKDMYNKYDLDNRPLTYKLLEEHIKQIAVNQKIVIISEDTNLSSITSNAYTKLVDSITVYVSTNPISMEKTETIYFGIDKDMVSEKLETNITFEKIKQIGLMKACKIIKNMCSGRNIHLSIDLRSLDPTIAPSVKRQSSCTKYLSLEDIKIIIKEFHASVSYLDILGFDESLDDSRFKYTKVTGEICKLIIRNIFDINEKSMNIFTEDSRFLIYRPVKQLFEDDKGWYIVRFLTLQEREIYLKYLIDNVITITIDNTINDNEINKELEVYVTSTSMQEQNSKSFYAAKSIYDYCLFPVEKLSMTFELLNT